MLNFLHFAGTSFEAAVATAELENTPILRTVGVKCRVDKSLQKSGLMQQIDAVSTGTAASPARDSK